MDAILDVVKSNQHLRKLTIQFNIIRDDHIEKLSSIVHNNPLVELDLSYSFNGPGVGDSILTTLLASRELELEILKMRDSRITSDGGAVMAEFLGANPKMKRLDVTNNKLNDSDVSLIANSLRSNTTLEFIYLGGGNTTVSLAQVFRPVMFDDSSLNAAADSNHICFLGDCTIHESHFILNNSYERYVNRGEKIYSLLSSRHRTMSNTQYFSDMDVKILPNMLDSIQRYEMIAQSSKDADTLDENQHDVTVGSLSIVYEVMRKWEKVFCLYE